jgi:hypothetical protein
VLIAVVDRLKGPQAQVETCAVHLIPGEHAHYASWLKRLWYADDALA